MGVVEAPLEGKTPAPAPSAPCRPPAAPPGTPVGGINAFPPAPVIPSVFTLSCGVFVSIGQKPNVECISGKVEQNPAGYIVTDCDMQTSVKGVFACGDVIKKPLYQVVTACSEGATAAFSAEKYLSSLKERR